jgi:hypothetical protein
MLRDSALRDSVFQQARPFDPPIELPQRLFTLQAMSLLPVANPFL